MTNKACLQAQYNPWMPACKVWIKTYCQFTRGISPRNNTRLCSLSCPVHHFHHKLKWGHRRYNYHTDRCQETGKGDQNSEWFFQAEPQNPTCQDETYSRKMWGPTIGQKKLDHSWLHLCHTVPSVSSLFLLLFWWVLLFLWTSWREKMLSQDPLGPSPSSAWGFCKHLLHLLQAGAQACNI